MDDFPYKFEKQFVDPESKLERIAHVFKDPASGMLYNTVLNRMDIRTNQNAYYKMQILESDLSPKTYWVFRSTGRVGTEFGDKFTEGFETADGAIVDFEFRFYEQTGNQFGKPFMDVPGKFVMVETEKHPVPSKLPSEVQELMKLIFNINAMKQAMADAALDTTKMPLGHLSKKQLEEGDACLNELEVLISTGAQRGDLIEPSNRFFSVVPHNFGLESAPVLDTIDAVHKKRELVDSLLQIEIAYAMMQDSATKENSMIDNNYEQLRADIFPLCKQSADYDMIRRYVENTQDPSCWKLELLEVFRVTRQGEKKRYRPFKNLPNRMLLWHGSPTTNFPSILSNGLRVNGGGLFFADSIAKSSYYCRSGPQNNIGLLLLCEVALGQAGQYVGRSLAPFPYRNGTHAQNGHSRIYGNTMPNPQESLTRDDGVVVPYGKLVQQNTQFSRYGNPLAGIFGSIAGFGIGLAGSLAGNAFGYPTHPGTAAGHSKKLFQPRMLPFYNEYIVQNAAQVNIQYLVKVKFHYSKQNHPYY